MEAGYVNHQNYVISEQREDDHEEALSIFMAATIDAYGNLVLGICIISLNSFYYPATVLPLQFS